MASTSPARRLVWPLLAVLLSGCVPWPRRALVVPAVTFEVTDEGGAPLSEAEVRVVRYSYPHARYEDSARLTTDAQGRATFVEVKEWETVWPLVPHGIPFYDFVFCVSAQDHVAVGGPVPDPLADVTVRLPAGDGDCPEANRLLQTARSSTVAFGASGP